jgi:hypothetical protein
MIVGGKGDGQGLEREGMGNSDDRRIATSPQPLSGTERGVGRCGAAIDVSGSPLLSRRGAGGEVMRPVSRRVNAQDSFSDAL